MVNSPVAITLVLALASADLQCEIQQGGRWSPLRTDIICNGVSGFFVSSSIYREMSRPEKSKPYRLLERSLSKRIQQIAELNSALAAGKRGAAHLEAALATTSSVSRSLMQDVEDLSRLTTRGWWESPALWLGLGFVGALLVSWAAANLRP